MLINTGNIYRNHQKPDFCYLCGKPLSIAPCNDDHCPPKSLFSDADKVNYATPIRVHVKCNSEWAPHDEIHAGMWAHQTKAQKKLIKAMARVNHRQLDDNTSLILNARIEPLISRIVRFGHALFYYSFLVDGQTSVYQMPFPRYNSKADRIENGNHHLAKKLGRLLLHSQSIGHHDGIKAYNGAFKYVCAWNNDDIGDHICIFAFDISRSGGLSPDGFIGPKCFIGFYKAPIPDGRQKTMRPPDDMILDGDPMLPFLF